MSWYWYVVGVMLVFDLCFLAYTLLLARRRVASDLLTYQPLEWPEMAKAGNEPPVTAGRRNSAGSNKNYS